MVSAARCCSTGSGRSINLNLDLDLLSFRSPRFPYLSPLARARALLARPWSAGCYGVARQREGSRQNGIGVSGVLSLRHFGLVLFIPWRVGAEEAGAAKDGFGGAMLLDRLGPLNKSKSGFRFIEFPVPAFTLSITLSAREGAAGQAVVCRLLRGRSPTRGVAPKRHRGLRRAFSPAFRAGSLYPLARGCRRSWRGQGWFRRRDAARPARAAQ